MLKLIDRYLHKLTKEGLCLPEDVYFIALDDEPCSNRPAPKKYLSLFQRMNINALLIGMPLEPYRSIMKAVIVYSASEGRIVPSDCETRTFFHDIPIIKEASTDLIVSALSKRKAAVTLDGMIVSCGSVSPEQAYIAFSSVCFTLFVKYLHDNIESFDCKSPKHGSDLLKVIMSEIKEIETPAHYKRSIGKSPKDKEDALALMAETGRAMVDLRLVDSYFGNISCLLNNTIFISQTGSSMDELETSIDAVPLDGSSTSGITASSEYSAHRAIYEKTNLRYIVHGHPKFTVILSMCCHRVDCRGEACYKSCPEKRKVGSAPIVSGEIGTGLHGLLNTVPEAIGEGRGVVVFGHGIFTGSEYSFLHALEYMIGLENYCIREYKNMLRLP